MSKKQPALKLDIFGCKCTPNMCDVIRVTIDVMSVDVNNQVRCWVLTAVPEASVSRFSARGLRCVRNYVRLHDVEVSRTEGRVAWHPCVAYTALRPTAIVSASCQVLATRPRPETGSFPTLASRLRPPRSIPNACPIPSALWILLLGSHRGVRVHVITWKKKNKRC